MIKSEQNRRSPLRILEKTTHGGVGKGNLGVIAARKGVGTCRELLVLPPANTLIYIDSSVSKIGSPSPTKDLAPIGPAWTSSKES